MMADGRLNKCTVALRDEKNQVGRLHEDGTVSIDGEKMLFWMRGLFSGDAFERKCPKQEASAG